MNKKRTYAMPIVALAFNLCWESLYAYVYLNRNIADIQAWITIGLRKEPICVFKTTKRNRT